MSRTASPATTATATQATHLERRHEWAKGDAEEELSDTAM